MDSTMIPPHRFQFDIENNGICLTCNLEKSHEVHVIPNHAYVSSVSGSVGCELCTLHWNASIHEIDEVTVGSKPTDKVTVFRQHVMFNVAGSPYCGICHNVKDNPLHIETSSSKDTYRKPIAYRFDLIPALALRRLAAIYEEGANVYGESKYVSSPMPHSNVVNHLLNHLNLAQAGDTTEDHFAKVAWAAFTLMVYEDLSIGRADLTRYGVAIQEVNLWVKKEAKDALDMG